MKVTDYLNNEDVFLIKSCKNKQKLYRMVLPHCIRTDKNTKISRGKIIKIMNQREKGGSFIVKEGCATPHARLENIKDPVVKFCYIKNGMEFENGKICNFVIVFVTPLDKTQTHLQIMAKTLSLFKKEEIIHRIRNAKSSDEIFNIIREDENTGHINYSSIAKESIFAELSSGENGLTTEDAEERIKKSGKNLLKKQKEISLLIEAIRSMLTISAILFLALGVICFLPKTDLPQIGWTIFSVAIIKTLYCYWKASKAERLIEPMQKLVSNRTKVFRDGKKQEMDSSDLVTGDIVFFEEGDMITADARLIETQEMKVSNSMLTGESRLIHKISEPVKNESSFLWTELPNMVFAGTTVISGSGKAVVVGTGMNTEVGVIASITRSFKKELNPLQKKTKKAVDIIVLIAVFLGILLISSNKLFGSLIVATGIIVYNIPGTLLQAISSILTKESKKMAKKNVLVNDLSSIKTLNTVSVICTDKTGIITTNQLNVRKLFMNGKNYRITGDSYEPIGEYFDENGKILEKKGLYSQEIFKIFFRIAVLCNNSSLLEPKSSEVNWNISGDPVEAALLVLAKKSGFSIDEAKSSNKRINYFPAETIRENMSVISEDEQGNSFVYIKGIPLDILEKCNYIHIDDEIREFTVEDRIKLKEKTEQFASEGLTVLAFAYKNADRNEFKAKEDAEEDLVFIGIAGIIDPIKPEVPEEIKKIKEAGIKLYITTGDCDAKAKAVARDIGLINDIDSCTVVNGFELSGMDDNKLNALLVEDKPIIFSRIEPIQKMRIATCIKNTGEIVAVTGTGVNDIMALKSGDVGIAMGNDVDSMTKEVADITALDGSLANIVYSKKAN